MESQVTTKQVLAAVALGGAMLLMGIGFAFSQPTPVAGTAKTVVTNAGTASFVGPVSISSGSAYSLAILGNSPVPFRIGNGTWTFTANGQSQARNVAGTTIIPYSFAGNTTTGLSSDGGTGFQLWSGAAINYVGNGSGNFFGDTSVATPFAARTAGTQSAPAWAYATDLDTGRYQCGANCEASVVGGVVVSTNNSTGVHFNNVEVASGTLSITGSGASITLQNTAAINSLQAGGNAVIQMNGSAKFVPTSTGAQLVGTLLQSNAANTTNTKYTDDTGATSINTGNAVANGTLVVKSTSSVILNPVLNIQNASGTSIFQVRESSHVVSVGSITATYFIGDGSGLTNAGGNTATSSYTVVGAFQVSGATFTVSTTGIISAPSQPAALARVNASQSIPNNVETLIGFGTTDFNFGNVYNGSFDTNKMTAPVGGAGLYDVDAKVFIPTAVGAGRAIINMKKNGTTYLPYCQAPISSVVDTIAPCHNTVSLAAGDYITISLNQNSGGAMDIYSSANVTTVLEFKKK